MRDHALAVLLTSSSPLPPETLSIQFPRRCFPILSCPSPVAGTRRFPFLSVFVLQLALWFSFSASARGHRVRRIVRTTSRRFPFPEFPTFSFVCCFLRRWPLHHACKAGIRRRVSRRPLFRAAFFFKPPPSLYFRLGLLQRLAREPFLT